MDAVQPIQMGEMAIDLLIRGHLINDRLIALARGLRSLDVAFRGG